MFLASGVAVGVIQSCYIYLLLCFLGLPTYLVLRRLRPSVPFSLGICFLAGLFWISILSWYAFVLDTKILYAYGVLGALASLTVAAVLVYWLRRPATLWSQAKNTVRATAPDALSFFVCVFAYSFLVMSKLRPGDLPLVTVGNGDLLSYLKMGNYLKIFPGGLPFTGAMDLKSYVSKDVFGSFNVVTFIATMAKTGVENVSISALGLGIGVFGAAVARACRLIFRLGTPLSILVAVLTITSPLMSYIVLNYFLSQILFIAILVTTASFLIESCESEKQSQTGCVGAVLLSSASVMLIYPPWLFQYVILMSALFAVLQLQSAPGTIGRQAISMLFRFIGCAGMCVIFACTLSLTRVTSSISKLMLVSEKNIAGWPLSFISPDLLIGIPDEWHGKDARQLVFGQSLFFFLVLGAILSLLWRLDRNEGKFCRRLYIAVFSATMLAYLASWAWFGNSYQQWKFATTVPIGFGFCVLAAGAYLATVSAPRLYLGLTRGLLACVFSACIVGSVSQFYDLHSLELYDNLDIYHFPQSLTSAKAVDSMPDTDQAYVDLPTFLSRMAAAVFINEKPVTFSGYTYFGGDGPAPPADSGRPYALVRTGCNVSGTSKLDYVTVNSRNQPEIPVGAVLRLDEKSDGCFDLTGFSGIESAGRWTDGHHASIRLRCGCDLAKDNIYIVLKADTFLPAGHLDKQQVMFTVNGAEPQSLITSQSGGNMLAVRTPPALPDRQSINVQIDLPDAISPAATGAGDTRVLGLYVASIELKSESDVPASAVRAVAATKP